MKNRIVISMMVLAMAGATLTGCGSTETEATTEATSEEVTEEVAEEEVVTEEEAVTEEVVEESAGEYSEPLVTDSTGRLYVNFSDIEDAEVQVMVDEFPEDADESLDSQLFVVNIYGEVCIADISMFDLLVADYIASSDGTNTSTATVDLLSLCELEYDDAVALVEASGLVPADGEYYIIDADCNVTTGTMADYEEMMMQ